MKLRLIRLFLLVGMIFAVSANAAAQSSYSFNLQKETVQVYWNSDGTEALDYTLTFANDAGAHPIDYVDMGMPNSNFDMSTVSADVNGTSVDTSTSDYQGSGSGFSVVMGSQTIQPGGYGTVHVVVGSITGVLYKDTSNPDTYASADFAPLTFGSQYVHGSTDLTVVFHLPPGVQPTEGRYHTPSSNWPGSQTPTAALDSQNRVTYTWESPAADGSSQYTFGASFPNQYIPSTAIVVPPAFDFAGLLGAIGGSLQTFCCIGFFVLIFVGIPIWSAISANRRKLQYLPPKISIEGHGIKRGLTAVEAAILMETPLDKVMTMILFGAVKKNATTVLAKDPLKLANAIPLPADLHDYETDFLKAMDKSDPAERRRGLQDMTIKLVNGVSDKMKGFSRKETVDYYKDIMERAWQQIEAAGTPEVKSQMYDEALEWTMLDHNYDERTRRVFTGPVIMPLWWGRYDPTINTSAASTSIGKSGVGGSSSSGGRVSIPGSAFAASVVTGVQGFSSKVIGDVQGFTSAVTNKTNPVPVSTSSGHSSGGGGHCACACACAGCACACAGGGR